MFGVLGVYNFGAVLVCAELFKVSVENNFKSLIKQLMLNFHTYERKAISFQKIDQSKRSSLDELNQCIDFLPDV